MRAQCKVNLNVKQAPSLDIENTKYDVTNRNYKRYTTTLLQYVDVNIMQYTFEFSAMCIVRHKIQAHVGNICWPFSQTCVLNIKLTTTSKLKCKVKHGGGGGGQRRSVGIASDSSLSG